MQIDKISASTAKSPGIKKHKHSSTAINTRDQVVLSPGKQDRQIQDMESLRKLPKPATGSTDRKELTVMFYMNGEYEDIGPTIQKSLLKLKGAGSDNNVNILAQIGFTPEKPDKESLRTRYDVRRYVITPDHKIQGDEYVKDRMNPDKVASPDTDTSITEPKALEDFIAFSMKKFPANHYMLVFMGHGGAWKGAVDLTPDQMGKAVKSALIRVSEDTGKDEKIDVTVFNSCLMANIEALSQMKDTSDITIASEDIARGGIFDFWDEVLGGLKQGIKDGNSFEPGKFARDFVELFRSFQTDNKDASISSIFKNMFNDKKCDKATDSLTKKFSYSTLSAIDNRKLKGLEDAFKNFITVLKKEKVPPRRFFKAISQAPDFKGFGDKIGGKYHYSANLRDFGHIMKIVKDSRRSNIRVKKAAARVLKALDDAMINEQHGGKEGEFQGLTIYAPTSAGAVVSDNEQYRKSAGEFGEKTGWTDYLTESAGNTPEWAREQVKTVDLPTLTKLGFEAHVSKNRLKSSFTHKVNEDNQKQHKEARNREMEKISSEPLVESEPYRFYQEDIQDWHSFLVSLKENRSPVEERILWFLDDRSRKYIDSWDKNKPVSEFAKRAITASFNKLLDNRKFADSDIFLKDEGTNKHLSKTTRELLEIGAKNLESDNLRALNRNLLQDIFPSGISAIFDENPRRFHADEILSRHPFFESLYDKKTPAQEHLYRSLDDDTRKVLKKCKKIGVIGEKELKTVVTGLNRILRNRKFPDREIFLKNGKLRRYMNNHTIELLNRKPEDLAEKDLKYLNRSLLSCMFPAGLSYHHYHLEFTARSSGEWQEKIDTAYKNEPKMEEFQMKLKLAESLAPYLDMTKKQE